MCITQESLKKNMPTEQEVWLRIVESYTRASNSTSSDKAIAWADRLTYAYKTRYLNNECNGYGK